MNIYNDWYVYEDEIENTFSPYFSESNCKSSITTDIGISDMDATIKSGIQQLNQRSSSLNKTDVLWQERAVLIRTGRWKEYKENRKHYIHMHTGSSKWLRYKEKREYKKYMYEEKRWMIYSI